MTIAVLKRRPFYTAISLFGISFTLLVLMVVTAMADHALAPMAPESRQARMLGVHSARDVRARHRVVERRRLPALRQVRPHPARRRGADDLLLVPDRLDLSRRPAHHLEPEADRRRLLARLRFHLPRGRARTARPTSTTPASSRSSPGRRASACSPGQPALGKTFEADGQSFRVVGVVENVPDIRFVPYADFFVPITTAKTDAYKRELMGGFQRRGAGADHRRPADHPRGVQRPAVADRAAGQEPTRRWSRRSKRSTTAIARESPLADRSSPDRQGPKLTLFLVILALLFVTLPTVNLVNVNISRILERASEIGVRKAFGAPTRKLDRAVRGRERDPDAARRRHRPGAVGAGAARHEPERLHRPLGLHHQRPRLRLRRADGVRLRPPLRASIRPGGWRGSTPSRPSREDRRDDPPPGTPDLEPEAPEPAADDRDPLRLPRRLRGRPVRAHLRRQRARAARLRHRARVDRSTSAGRARWPARTARRPPPRRRRGSARSSPGCWRRSASCRRSRSRPARSPGRTSTRAGAAG